jgi:hypothetical protein
MSVPDREADENTYFTGEMLSGRVKFKEDRTVTF